MVHIKPLSKEQALTSYRWRNDPAVWEFTGKRPDRFITQEVETAWIERVLQESNSKRFGIWSDDVYIGNVQLTGIVEKQAAEFHIFIGEKDFWGKGIAKLATLQILRFAKFTLQLRSVFLKVNAGHNNAFKLYKTCGFEEVGEQDGWLDMKVDLFGGVPRPKLSVFMMTYNHGAYLSRALDGILQQKCGFDFDVIIGDDFSADNTREVIQRYSERFPGRIIPLLHSKNIGPYQNQHAVLEACKGQYIAICEGDDYWDDPEKLQKQVDFLDANPDYVISFHEVERIDANGIPINQPVLGKERWKDLDREQLLAGELVPSVSAVFRTNHLGEFLKIQQPVKNGDTLLFAILGQYGKAHFHPDIVPAKYRIHGGGVWSGSDQKSKIESQILTFETLHEVILPENREIVKVSLFYKYFKQITRFDYSSWEKLIMYLRLWKFCFENRLLGKMISTHFLALKNKI